MKCPLAARDQSRSPKGLLRPANEAFQRAWDTRPDPPAITAAIAIRLARPEFLVEMDAVAVVAEQR